MKKYRIRFFGWRPRRSLKLLGTSALFKRFSSFEGLELRAVLSGSSLLSDSGMYSSGLGDDSDAHASPVNLLSISCMLASNQNQNDSDNSTTNDDPPPAAPLTANESESDDSSDPIVEPLVEGNFGDVTVAFENLTGGAISNVSVGEEFVLKLFVADSRTQPTDVINGFFSAYAGVTFDATKFEVADPNSLTVDEFFSNFHVRTNIAAGKVRAGGTTFEAEPNFEPGEPQLLWSVRMRATAGSATPVAFTPTFEDFDDVGTAEEWLLYDLETNDRLAASNFDFTASSLGVDAEPSLSITDVSKVEGDTDQTYLFTVTLANPAEGNVTVAYNTVPGTAAAGSDYTATSGTLTFSGTTTQVITVTVVGDLVSEPDEQFSVVLSNPTNAELSDATALGTITNDDTSLITISSVSQNEGNETNTMLFTVGLTKASGVPVTVQFTTQNNNSATAGSDYTATSGTLSFAAGSTTAQTITVTISGDTTVEANETFQVLLSSPVGAALETPGPVTGTLVNDDGPILSITPATITRAEGDANSTAVFTVSLANFAGTNVVVNYATVAGTATAGNDYTATSGTLTFSTADNGPKTVTVTIVGDEIGEVDEEFSVQLSNPTGGTINQGTATITLENDDDPAITITGPANKNENANGGQYVLTATLSEQSDQPITVVWNTANDTATAGSDYTATSGTLTFAPNSTTATFVVNVTGDTTIENNEKFKILLTNPVNASLPQTEFLADILNDDLPTVSISTASSANEGPTGTNTPFVFTVNLSQAVDGPVTVVYNTVDLIAKVSDNDYIATSGTLTFDQNITSRTITVQVIGDAKKEDASETFRVDLSSPVGAILSTTNDKATASIVDDDAPPTASIGDVSKAETDSGTTQFLFTVTLTAAANGNATVAFTTQNGTATAGSDYTATSGTLTFTGGSTTQVITVNVTGDLNDEADETFTVTLSNPSSNITILDSSGLGTIQDEAGDSVQIIPSMVSGRVFVDRDGSGDQGIYEASVAGATVALTGAATQQTTSSATGAYSFSNLVPGTYTVTFTLPTKYREGDPVLGSLGGTENDNGYSFTIPAAGGQAATGYHFVTPGPKLAFASIRDFQSSVLGDLTDPPGEVVAVSVNSVTNPINASNATSTSVSGNGTPGTSISVVVSDGTNSTAPFTTTVAANGTWTITNINVVTLADGTLTYTATATGEDNETATASITTTKGTTTANVAVTTVTSPVNAGNVTQTSISGTGTQNGVVTVTVTDGTTTTSPVTATVGGNGQWSIANIDVSSLANGTITYNVSINVNGNTATTSRTTTKDTQLPTVAIDPVDPINTTNEEEYEISGTGQAGDTISVTITGPSTGQIELDDVEVAANGTWSIDEIDLSSLADGTITFNVTATDDNGNTAQANRTATKDTAAENLLIMAVTDPINNENETETEITGTGEIGATVSVIASDGTNSTTAKTAVVAEDETWTISDIDVSGLNDGTITYTVTMTDLAGNTDTDSVQPVKDTEDPSLDVNEVTDPIGLAEADNVGASGTGDNGDEISVVVSDGTNQTTAVTTEVDEEGNWSVTGIDVSALKDGTLTYIVTATDAQENVTTDNSKTAIKKTVEVTAITEEITQENEEAFTLSGTGQAGATVSVVASDGTDNTEPVEVEIAANGTWTLDVDVSSLDDGTITFTVTATEGDDSVARTATAEKDTVAEAVINTVTTPINAANDQATSVSGTGEPNADLSVEASDGITTLPAVTGEIATDGSWTVSDIDVSTLTDTTITYTVTVTDALGNVTEYTITSVKDVVAPELEIVEFSEVVNLGNRTNLSISGTSDGAATIKVLVTDGTDSTTEYTATIGTGGVWSVEGIDASTLSDGPVTYRVTASDAAGNVTVEEEIVQKQTLSVDELTEEITQENEAAYELSGTGQPNAAVSIVASDGTTTLPAVEGTIGENGEWTVSVNVSSLLDGTITFTITASEGDASLEKVVTAEKDTEAEAEILDVTNPITFANQNSTTISGTGEPLATLSITATDGTTTITAVTGSISAAGTWSVGSINVSTLLDVMITYTVVVTDALGNESTYTIEAPKDTVAVGEITEVTELINNQNQTTTEVTGTAELGTTSVSVVASDGTNDTEPKTVTLTTTGSPWTIDNIDVTSLANGTITYTVTFTDSVGNTSTDTIETQKSVATPGLTVADVTDPIGLAEAENVGASGTGDEGDTISVVVSDGTNETVAETTEVAAGGAWTIAGIDVSALKDGTLTYVITATDADGNVTTNSTQTATKTTLEIDEITETITSENDEDFEISGTGQNGATVSIVASDGTNVTAAVEVTITDGVWSSPLDLTALEDGEITFTVTATQGADSVARTATADKDTIVEFAANPTDPITIANVASYTFSGTGEVGAEVKIQIADLPPASTTIGESGEWELVMNLSSLADGELTFEITVTDSVGNVLNAAAFKEKATLSIDAITDGVTSGNELAFALSGLAEVGSTVSIVASDGTNIASSAEVVVGAGGTWTLPLDLSGLADGTITFTVTATVGTASVERTATAEKATDAELLAAEDEDDGNSALDQVLSLDEEWLSFD